MDRTSRTRFRKTRRRMNRPVAALVVLLAASASNAFAGDLEPGTIAARLSVRVGETGEIRLNPRISAVAVEDPSIADGAVQGDSIRITGKATGSTTLRLTLADGTQRNAVVNVASPGVPHDEIMKLKVLVGGKGTLAIGRGAALREVGVEGSGIVEAHTVDDRLEVFGKAPGQTVVTVKTSEGRTQKCVVEVVENTKGR